MSTLTKIVLTRRKLLNITQYELATKLGFSNGQFASNVERGVCEWPPKYFKKISNLLRLDLDEIIEANMEDHLKWLKRSL